MTGDGVADGVIMVNMVNFFPVDGYQFSFSMDPAVVAAVAAVDGTYIQYAGCVQQAIAGGGPADQAGAYCESLGYSSGLESATMSAPGSSGIVMGYSMAGGSGDSNALGMVHPRNDDFAMLTRVPQRALGQPIVDLLLDHEIKAWIREIGRAHV